LKYVCKLSYFPQAVIESDKKTLSWVKN